MKTAGRVDGSSCSGREFWSEFIFSITLEDQIEQR